MARHAAPAENAGSSSHKPARSQRAQARARRAEEQARQRRLAEREQVSGEIRTPAGVTARRARRTDKPQRQTPTPHRTPVSARTLVPERKFSGRMIVLTIVTLVIISFLVPTLRTYLQQRAEINELAEQIAEEEQQQAQLYSELARWDDPEFVRQQARERINLVMPGERRYHVIGDPADLPSSEQAQEQAPGEGEDWTGELWESVVESAEE